MTEAKRTTEVISNYWRTLSTFDSPILGGLR